MNIIHSISKITVLSLFLLSGQCMYAQNDNNNQNLIPDLPPSPQAEAFNRLGDYQVNNNYGAPDISIPLFEIDFHGYKIPLTLHYEATPMKPGYNYDVTGMGWTLSGNSCVSRTIKDRPDEQTIYNFSKPFELDNPSDYYMTLYDYSEVFRKVNFQYDSYNIILPTGRSIPFFMFMKDNVMRYALTDNDKHVKIVCNYDRSGNPHTINSFYVTDENGVTYAFTQEERGNNTFDDDPNKWANVTWLLTSVSIPSKGTISYEYTDEFTFYTRTVSEPAVRFHRMTSQLSSDSQIPRFSVTKAFITQSPRYKMRFLKSIMYGPTKVNITYSDNHISDIVVTDHQALVKKFTLGISGSYLTSLVVSGQNDVDSLVYGFDYWENDYIYNNNISTDYWGNLIMNTNGNTDVANFNMFFNCRSWATINIDTTYQSQLMDTRFLSNKPSDPEYYRKIKLQYSEDGNTRAATSPESHGVLRSITYPNGGYAMFAFENHRFPTATAEDGDFVFDRRRQNIIEGGGFRIKSIINYTADGTVASQDHYRYGFTYEDISRRNFPLPLPSNYNPHNHIGCGEAVVDPNILTFLNDFTCYDISTGHYGFQKMIVGLDSPLKDMYSTQGGATWWDAEFSANAFRTLLDGRRPIVYPEITVYHGNPDEQNSCNSKRVYKYDIYNYQHSRGIDYQALIRGLFEADTTYFEMLHYDYQNYNLDLPMLMYDKYMAGRRHQLKSMEDYSYDPATETWDLTYMEKYKYQEAYTFSNDKPALIGYMYNNNISRRRHTNYDYQLGTPMWYNYYRLSDFYPTQITQMVGQSTMVSKSTTQLQRGEIPSFGNTQTEYFSYLCPGVLRHRDYQDLYYEIIRVSSYDICDKRDVYSYLGEEDDDPITEDMRSRNMLASLTGIETFTDINFSTRLKGTKIEYGYFGDEILPSKLYEANGDDYEESLQVISYCWDNPEEIVDLKTGMHSVFLWDADGRYLVAEIRNATMSDIESQVGRLQAEDSMTRYASLKALLPNSQIQTWDHKPLIGVTSHTDINGQTISYEYDGLGRLKREKRIINEVQEPEILHEYEYNYLNQQLLY